MTIPRLSRRRYVLSLALGLAYKADVGDLRDYGDRRDREGCRRPGRPTCWPTAMCSGGALDGIRDMPTSRWSPWWPATRTCDSRLSDRVEVPAPPQPVAVGRRWRPASRRLERLPAAVRQVAVGIALENYYDRFWSGFEATFAGTDVGRNPTGEQSRYVVLRFDFSAVNGRNAGARVRDLLHHELRAATRSRPEAALRDILRAVPGGRASAGDHAAVSGRALHRAGRGPRLGAGVLRRRDGITPCSG